VLKKNRPKTIKKNRLKANIRRMQLAEVMQKNLKRTVNIFEPCSTAAESLIVFSSEYFQKKSFNVKKV
jgi:hypothetical protein